MKKSLLLLTIILTAIRGFGQNLQISGGNDFSAAVCDNQTVYVWGENNAGQLAITATDAPVAAAFSNTPKGVTRGNVSNTTTLTYGNLPAISQVDAGSGAHVLGLSCAGQVWAWGGGVNGQLGRGSLTNSPIPQRVLRGAQAASTSPNDPNGIFLNNIFYVSGGNNSSFALEKTTGRVLSWGQNANGQLGNGNLVDQVTPVYVMINATTQLTNIIQIEGGDNCTYALDAAGNVWSWGSNDGNKLGRPGAGNQPYAARVIQGDPLNNGYSATPTPAIFLSNIIQISGGDTHCLALDSKGNVWSFGGDWGQGQLGRAGGEVYQDDARRVSIPGLTTYATAENQFLGNGSDGKAVYVSAGQANSAVVMANGRVVTFGARGLYNSGVTTLSSGSITCPLPDGNMIASGALGDGNTTACNSTTCDGKAAQFSRTPVYVRTTTGILTGITQVSDGDAWFYAISGTGSAYVWGWNRRGELGLGDYVDRCYAVPFSLPTGCAFSDPCPGKPNLGPDVVTCPGFSATLNSNIPQAYLSYKYTWEYRSGTTGAWLPLGTPLGDNVTYTPADKFGQYRVTITDNRASVPFLCAPCPVYMDTITYSPAPSPYVTGGCVDATANKASFYIITPDNLPVKWYKNLTDPAGSELNPSDTKDSIVVPFTSTNTSSPGCARALYAEDKSSISGAIIKTQPCNPSAEGNVNGPLYTMITSTQAIKLTEVSFFQGSGWGAGTFELSIYPNVIPGSIYCNDCSPAGSYNGPSGSGTVIATTTFPEATSARTWTLATPYDLPAGTYWIGIKATAGALKPFNCATAINASSNIWTTLETEPNGVLTGKAAIVGNNSKNKGGLFNIKYTSGPTYSCGRILVCATGTCTLPVEFVSFDAQRISLSLVSVNWATAKEEKAKEFIIERSFDGINFVTVGTVKAAGNSNSLLTYSFTDKNDFKGTSYYRVREIDFNGDITSTNVVAVNGSGASSFKYKIIPNPNKGVFKVQIINPSKGNYEFRITDILGQEVYEVSSNFDEGTLFEKEMNLSHLASGVYLLNIVGENDNLIEKIIIE